jgi:hypothetical protein
MSASRNAHWRELRNLKFASPKTLAKFNDLWQAVGMANKNAPKREKKKPSKKKKAKG